MVAPSEQKYLDAAPVGRPATADAEGRPHVVPVCFAFADGEIVTPVDEKPQDVAPTALRRVRDIQENPRVALVVDHYTDNWSELGWVQVRGTAALVDPDDSCHSTAVTALRSKDDQYETHSLEERPCIRVSPGSVRSWGALLLLGWNDRLVFVGVADADSMAGVTRVGNRPPTRRAFRQELLAVRAVLAGCGPRGDVVGIVSRVALVVECELLEGAVSGPELVQFVREIPLAITARTGDSRHVVDVVWTDVGWMIFV